MKRRIIYLLVLMISLSKVGMGQDLTILNYSQSFVYKKSNIIPNYFPSSGCLTSLLIDYSGTGSTSYPTQSSSPIDVGTYSAFIYFLNGSINSSTGLPCSGSGTITFSITPKNLNITGIIANNKQYDGNNIVPLTGSSSLLTAENIGSGSVIDGKPYVGDNVILNGSAYGQFPNSLVENSKIVTISSLTISGTSAFNYNLIFPTGLTANIIPKDITGSFVASNKQYDGNNTATVTSTSLGAIVGSEVVTLNGGTATFNDASVANGKTVTLVGATLGGANASNYNLVSVSTTTANITSINLIITGITGKNKVYDGNTTASVSGTPSYSGLVSGEIFSVIGTPTFTFNDKNVGTAKPITVSGYTPPSTNYTLTQPTGLTADITVASLTINGITGQNKIYDGNNTAFINGAAVYSGLVTGDNFSVAGTPSFLFTDKNVGTAKSITVSGYITPSSNYILSAQPTGLTADITPKSLAITGLVANNKPYDGTTTATVNGTAAYDGLVAADAGLATVQGGPSFNFDTKDVGTNKPVTVTGYTAPSTNYTLTQPTGLTAAITPKAITVTGITGGTKVYDGNTTATVTGTPVYAGLVSGESLTVVGTATYSFADKNAGTAKAITVTGFAAPNGNYTLSSQPTGLTGNITQRLLNITSVNYEKVYDATKNAPGLILNIDPLLGDNVSISRTGALFDNANEGVNKDIIVAGLSLIPGGDAANYYLASNTATVKGTIKPLPINIVAIDASKTELDPDPPFTYQPVSLLGTDVFTGSLSRFPGEAPGDYPMTIGNLSAGSNYTLNFTTANFKIKPLVTNYIFEVPTAFTPNLDATNDVLKIITNYRVTGLNYFKIYNRTGQLVFQTSNLTEGWNGRRMNDLSGNILDSDLYMWIAEFTNMNDSGPVKKTGSVLLLK